MTGNGRAIGVSILTWLGAAVLSGCAAKQPATTVSITGASDVRIFTTSESSEAWSSTYGSPRPKLQHVISLGTIDLPAPSGAPAAPKSAEQPVIHIENETTQTNVVIVPTPRYRPIQRSKEPARLNPRTQAARLAAPASKQLSPPRAANSSDKNPQKRRDSPRTQHAPFALVGSVGETP